MDRSETLSLTCALPASDSLTSYSGMLPRRVFGIRRRYERGLGFRLGFGANARGERVERYGGQVGVDNFAGME
ncbi:hypothetical protein Pyn_27063 [Prunus yedoensis var. nudiflora]|uniref:Uncharacterized protein n=1 Tax=Prunus yedoensis var. nudiflora TaxID=2094558 RepID=A0A314UFZ1_PRUYE|nr:hypothetical protein Pyn_27063 [Prunus yedoensis var. nudiflora]